MSTQPMILDYLNGTRPETIPFMPIFMRYAERFGKVLYREFCLNTEAHCPAIRKTGEAFSSDGVNVMSDPYAESKVFGVNIHDPVGIIQNMHPEQIKVDARKPLTQAPGKLILSDGCEITPDTSEELAKR